MRADADAKRQPGPCRAGSYVLMPTSHHAQSVLLLTLATAARLFAQSSPSHRITQTYAMRGYGAWDYIGPDPRTIVFLSRVKTA
jgi:hypothetical protein